LTATATWTLSTRIARDETLSAHVHVAVKVHVDDQD
jgi:hypothetical protein